MNFEAFFEDKLGGLHKAGNYRVFADIERHAGGFPRATRYRPMAPRRTSRSGAPTIIWAWARIRW
jgi:hypothetical protein